MKPKQIYHKVQLNQENVLRQQLLGKQKDQKSIKNDFSKLLLNFNNLILKTLKAT